jgi:hypothetical protein
MSHPCLQVRRSARARAVMTMRTLLVSAVSLLVTTGVSSAADPDSISGMHGGDLAVNKRPRITPPPLNTPIA